MDNFLLGLDKIAWRNIGVSSGKAANVPAALRGLISSDERIRHKSYWRLENEIVLQSDLYEAAYFVVPILVGLLQQRVPYGRELVYKLIQEIANGYAPDSVTCHTKEGKILALTEACKVEILKGYHVYVRDVSDPTSVVVEKAKQLLEYLE